MKVQGTKRVRMGTTNKTKGQRPDGSECDLGCEIITRRGVFDGMEWNTTMPSLQSDIVFRDVSIHRPRVRQVLARVEERRTSWLQIQARHRLSKCRQDFAISEER